MRHPVLSSALLCIAPLFVAACASAQPYDLLITGARIVDGSGNAWFQADLAVRGGRIAAIGRLQGQPAHRTIDARGLTAAPGFVDMMGASSEPLLADRTTAESKLRQGITTILAGEGGSVAPSEKWPRFSSYFAALEKAGIPLNVVHNVGAAQVRRQVIGDQDRAPTPEEMSQMRALVDEAMRDGAVGFSTALIYPPGTYARTEELVEMAKVVGQYGGLYLTHMRNESHAVLEAIRESIHIGRSAGIPVHVFHLKAAGERNWPKMAEAVNLIQQARGEGLDVTADIYPYINNGIGLGSFLHPRHYAQGAGPFLKTLSDPTARAALRREVETTLDWENWYDHVGRDWANVIIARAEGVSGVEGKSIAEVARGRGIDGWDAFFDLVLAGASVCPRSMNEAQKHLALRTPWVSFCTDAPPTSFTAAGTHPRAFGSYPRVLAKYVREEKIIPLEEAVRKMTSLAANRLGLYDRGRLAPGMAADVVLFDAARVRDTATFARPLSYAEGIPYVIVNGVPAIDNGRFTSENGGAVLRRR